MYLEHYGLKEPPFSITPDPRFVYLSERHRDALAHLLYGIGQGGGGGFVQLTGEVGTGKTTLCRLLLEQLPQLENGAGTRVALVLNPKLSPLELMQTICEELRLDVGAARGSLKDLVDALNHFLLDAYAQGLHVVLIVDEAQELSRDALEQVRLLTNLETPTQKLLQVILLGQPELRDLLAQPELRQLAQRITARYHLTPLDADETEAYVRHRLAVAGAQRFPFSKLALKRIHTHSGGVPRLINVIAERALLAGFAREQSLIGEDLLDQAAKETLAPPPLRWAAKTRIRPPRLAWFALAALALVLLGLWTLPRLRKPATPGTDAAAAAPAPAPDPSLPLFDGETFSLRVIEAGPSSLLIWNRLLALWMVRAQEADLLKASGCPPQPAPGLFCVRARGNLTKLAALARPALLHLRSEGREAWALLLGVDALRARLALGGDTFEVDRAELERLWPGEYIALWRAPAFVTMPLRQGDAGPAVDWLHDRLARDAKAKFRRVGPGVYGADTAAAVRRVQTAHGLRPDGVVGPETLLALTADDGEGPQLRRQLTADSRQEGVQ